MNAEHLAIVTDAFGLGAPVSVANDTEGVLNLNYDLVTDTGCYFVKSVRDRRKDSIPVIAVAESFMHDGGIPAVTMLRTANGDLFVPCGDDVYTVYPYIEHAVGSAGKPDALGEMLARIHKRGSESLPATLAGTLMREKDIERVRTKLTEYHEHACADESGFKDDFLEYIELKQSLLDHLAPYTELPRVLAHGDYHTRNILMNEEGTILGICDWEKSELAPRAYEIARSIQYICFEGREDRAAWRPVEAVAAAKEFLKGYQSVCPIGNDELRTGFAVRQRKLVMSFWIEERFYDMQDARANQFLRNEINLIRGFAEPALTESLLS